MELLSNYNKLKNWPFGLGKKLVTFMVDRTAPYFKTIHCQIVDLEKGKCVITTPDRKDMHNHIGTVHAIAQCNMCEYAMGVLTVATIPKKFRWIPKGMTVEYLLVAAGKLTTEAIFPEENFVLGDIEIPVKIYNEKREVVMSAQIKLYITPNK
jgi:hypothetical protein